MATKQPEDEVIRLHIDGKEFTLDPEDLELGEIELLEEELDASMEEIDFTRAKAMRVLVYLLVHRENTDYTMEDAARVKLSALADPTEHTNGNGNGNGGAKAKRPTKAAAPRG